MNAELLAPPEVTDVRVTFIMEDDSVMQSGPDGKLIQVHGPVTLREQRERCRAMANFCAFGGCTGIAYTGRYCAAHVGKVKSAPRPAMDAW